jgi:hypothetical protein
MKTVSIVLSLALAASCANIRPADTPPPPPPSEFQNLQVLPPDIPRAQLIQTMKNFARGLGVRCNHCHVVTATEPEEQLDFPSDAKEEKRAARVMLQMVQQINGPWLERVEIAEHGAGAVAEESDEDEGPRVVCWTCHRGKPEPEAPPPPPQG